MAKLNADEYRCFEDLKTTRMDGSEFWSARELATVLDYSEWRNFSRVIDKTRLSCKNSGFDNDDHFVEVNKMVDIGSGTSRGVIDYELSAR